MLMEKNITVLENIKNKKLSQYNSLQKKIYKVKNLEKTIKELQNRIAVIKKIRQKQNLPIIYIDEIVSAIPENKLWFTFFDLSSGGKVNLRGIALDNQALAFYIDRLKKAAHVKQVEILLTNRKRVGKYEFVEFNCVVNMGKKS
ncbi:MAG: PilN domain-containing protein [Desulfonauticus sp.]|nr:PilN domain-containing protein [Desulfonauticus sp.]